MSVPPLDPDVAARVAALGTVPSMRSRGIEAVRSGVEAMAPPTSMPAVAQIENHTVPGPYGPLDLRIYRSTTGPAAPVVIHLHGGGLAMGSNASFEPLARHLARASGATVIGVDYRLAPEWPAPVQVEESYAATVWVAEHARELRVDPERLVVLGDSAGGGLAAGVALMARDRGGPALFAQVLLYPGLDRDLGAASVVAMPDAPMLSREDILYLHELADAGSSRPADCYRVPAYATDLSGLPQAIVVTAAGDPIRDWGERYAARLRDAHVQTTLTRYPGVLHGFLMRPENSARALLAIAETGALLRAKFDNALPWPTRAAGS
ncbi:alpha/beta hydrolase [Nocardia farcinica]|uniref:alpha/beta hydrolase n=1 Tax=Nocardia farcinica TaxID=37329 RepID=UPI0018937FD1|nr:alpha/beta hydrolase [Nocardia farcinica]MBF6188988.1 alpha/beta hydrolase [Nocardia farcinica]MBF6309419.1 alpha/beta hydrolase [Nocardia farcinica]MBF6410742.1 alpha/beta hydrolase [Nocardia farcinica]UEX20610.1 alpha/beta hydrolase [Nocardia farcinica]